MINFKAKVIGGLKWSFLGQFSNQFISIIISLLMARLIAPEYFGQVAMVNIAIGFSSIFLDLGFGAALIQKKNVDEIDYSTVFILNIILGVLLSSLLFLSSEFLKSFYNQPEVAEIAQVLSPIFILSALGNVPRTYLNKLMDFKRLSIFSWLSMVFGGLTGLIVALMGYPLYAILSQILVQSISANFLPLFLGKWKISFIFSKAVLKEIGSFSGYLLGNNVLNYWVRNIDNLLIGKYLGSYDLGIYSKSYAFLIIPLNNSSRAISKVLFPSLSEIQSDNKRVKTMYLKVIGSIAILIYPVLIGGFVTADKLVLVLLGENWVESAKLIQVFCLLAMIQSISSMVTNLYLSQGRADLMFKVGTSLRVLLISAMVIGLNWGTMGVALSYLVAGFISANINTFYAGRLVGIKLSDVGKSLLFPFLIALMMGFLVYFLDVFLLKELSLAIRFLLQICVGGSVYFLLNEILKPTIYIQLKELLKDQLYKKNTT